MCFFFNETATTEIYTLPLHDALPILFGEAAGDFEAPVDLAQENVDGFALDPDLPVFPGHDGGGSAFPDAAQLVLVKFQFSDIGLPVAIVGIFDLLADEVMAERFPQGNPRERPHAADALGT